MDLQTQLQVCVILSLHGALISPKLINDLVAASHMKSFYKCVSCKLKLIQVEKLLAQPSPYFLHDQPLPN